MVGWSTPRKALIGWLVVAASSGYRTGTRSGSGCETGVAGP
jgi:hypothetical protein